MRFQFVLFLAIFSPPLVADGNDLLIACEKAIEVFATDGEALFTLPSSYGHGTKVGYCWGVIKTHRQKNRLFTKEFLGENYLPTLQSLRKARVRACPIPDYMSVQQLIRILVKNLKEEPELLHFAEVILLERAFKEETIPCEMD